MFHIAGWINQYNLMPVAPLQVAEEHTAWCQCGTARIKLQPRLVLLVSLPAGCTTLTEAMNRRATPVHTQLDCTRCKATSQAMSTTSIRRGPACLWIQLLRFTAGYEKNSENISFPLEGLRVATETDAGDEYDLVAAVLHSGSGISGGKVEKYTRHRHESIVSLRLNVHVTASLWGCVQSF